MTAAPAPRPCGSCPYRRDVPSGVWAEDEYDKLPRYDEDTHGQPAAAFFCHQQDGRLCAGWVGCHDMGNSLGLRFAGMAGRLTPAEFDACLDYTTDVPLFASGAEAAAHGKWNLAAPDVRAQRTMQKVSARQARTRARGGAE